MQFLYLAASGSARTAMLELGGNEPRFGAMKNAQERSRKGRTRLSEWGLRELEWVKKYWRGRESTENVGTRKEKLELRGQRKLACSF